MFLWIMLLTTFQHCLFYLALYSLNIGHSLNYVTNNIYRLILRGFLLIVLLEELERSKPPLLQGRLLSILSRRMFHLLFRSDAVFAYDYYSHIRYRKILVADKNLFKFFE